MSDLKIVIAGVGTVGSGVLNLLKKNHRKIESKIGKKVNVVGIASRREFKSKQFKNTKIFSDAIELTSFNNYDVLIELIGGSDGVAKEIVFDALKKKKNVITANKALISKHGNELIKISNSNKAYIGFEAAVAGGIPIITILENFLVSNSIKTVVGILNGTSNYILSKMFETKKDFKAILHQAQSLGYAETDPTFDINGTDTAHKLSILASLAFKKKINIKKVYISGIQDIDYIDLRVADELGYKIKLVGITKKLKSKIIQYVYPCLIKKNSLLGKVDNVCNGIIIESDSSKKLFLQGEGAGSLPTATSVLSDLCRISSLSKSSFTNEKLKTLGKENSIMISQRVGSYYLRINTYDKPGVIADISKSLKKYSISIKSLYQKENITEQNNYAHVVITTHNCTEKNLNNAIKVINKLSSTKKKVVVYRIETI